MSTPKRPRNKMVVVTLRDYFAAHALMSAFADGNTDVDDAILARRCYELADAMLAERGKP